MKYGGNWKSGERATNNTFHSSFNILDFVGKVTDLRGDENGTVSPIKDVKTTSDLAIYIPILIFCFPVIVMAITCFMRLRINVLHLRQRKSLHRYNHSVSVSMPLVADNGAGKRPTIKNNKTPVAEAPERSH
ncbi:uncharacterized protein LOC121382579 isoform X2 [Gigantopelta aegis]|uniref:uncharacterized protein LOC121382579 isoform X2 n=1 Tax=Gigantopelta aegis TaxID=1735272 RepID=UPI001B889313|nr:uncharacterized protein LOC121382579 isoform X2 [Gigantopelta aegis]XP_041367994.1 uncharacterized protein LOC121382579 isoform X2 [Gigantopelta aegis]XP_041367995.1 uncharacterized protein LOC121382579 isoform X2 [Gigantopelta aegis]